MFEGFQDAPGGKAGGLAAFAWGVEKAEMEEDIGWEGGFGERGYEVAED